MIGHLRGRLAAKHPPQLLIDVGGVGYEVEAPMSTFYGLPAVGAEVSLHTHLVVREDAHVLFGFGTERERSLFRELIKVSGVGPRIALGILSGISVDDFHRCVEASDAASLTRVPGIGRKTAERLIVEMRDRLKALAGPPSAGQRTGRHGCDSGGEPTGRGVQRAGRARLQAGRSHPAAAESGRVCGHDRRPDPPGAARRGQLKQAEAHTMPIEQDRVISTATQRDEEVYDRAVRPKTLADYVGQPAMKAQMEIFIQAARKRGESLDHVLIFGPPGLGKTTLAHVIANELGVGFKQTSGPVLERPGDLAALLTNLQPNELLFVDEIHRLSPVVEEILYPALEDFQLDIMIGEGPGARSIKIDLPPFTLVGATTRAGLLTSPLRDRFGIVQRLEFYTHADLKSIVQRSAGILGVAMDEGGAEQIATRSRGTPRIANRLLRRVRDFAEVKGDGRVTPEIARGALDLLDVDPQGFDPMDRRLMLTIIEKFEGGPVGVDSLAAALGEERGTIEDVIEPFLIQQGYIMRTARGRVATRNAYLHFGLTPPALERPGTLGLFES